MSCFLLAVSACSERPPAASTETSIWFEDQTKERGVYFAHVSGASGEFDLPEITGGGVALLDVENDGDLDIYFVQSGSLYEYETEPHRNELYLNDGTGNFTKSNSEDDHAHAGYGMGAAAADYDNDGDIDIYITNVGANTLLQNDGTGYFIEVTEQAHVNDDSWGTAASFADFDRDGDLDLYVANYLHWDRLTALDCYATNIETYCVPLHNYAAMDRVFRNNGDGTFSNVTLEAGLGAAFGNGLGVVSVDVNDDGWVDVFVANDSMVNQLWINQRDFTFVNDAWFWGVAMDDHGIEKAGMGIATFDYEDDGDFDVLVVNIEAQSDSFFRNEGTFFSDATGEVNLGAHSRRFTRFGLAAVDFDNDGCIDLYQANGSVYHNEEDLDKDDYFQEPNTLYRGTCGAKFELVRPEGGTSTAIERTSRGLAVGDLDNDGFQDLVIVNKDAAATFLINVRQRSQNNGIRFRVLDERGRDAYNSRLTTTVGDRKLTRRVQTDGSYLAAHDPHVHIGTGNEPVVADVTVRWLDGSFETFGSFQVKGRYTLRRGSGTSLPR